MEREASGAELGRQIWLQERRAGIGGSDAAAILGVAKYGTPLSVWMDKTGRVPIEKIESEPMWWGTALEDLIARRYTQKTARHVWKPDRLMQHPEWPMIVGTPDRLVIGQKRGLEIKTADDHLTGEWGKAGTDQVPHGYAIQCHLYMAITGFPQWDVAVLIGGNDFRIYTLTRDEQFEAAMIERLVRWWNIYVVTDTRPPIEAGDTHTLDLMYPDARDEQMIVAMTADDRDAREMFDLQALVTATDEQIEARKNRLKARIGDTSGIAGDGWKITWKQSSARKSTDYQKVSALLAESLAEAIGHEAAARIHNAAREQAEVEKPGIRSFRSYPPKG